MDIDMKKKNIEYWLAKDGEQYAYQQKNRSLSQDATYHLQERWILRYVRELSMSSSKPIKVLDFGCGFGRFAYLLSKEQNTQYYGFDISKSMVKPLFDNPPPNLEQIEDRVKIGMSLDEAFPTDHFDLIFTVSVLIHQDVLSAVEILSSMRSHLNPRGKICLIENKYVPFSFLDNHWHSGCWLHNHPEGGLLELDVDVLTTVLPEHDIYLASEAEGNRRLRLSCKDHDLKTITDEELRLTGLTRLKQAVSSRELSEEQSITGAKESELLEINSYQAKELDFLRAELKKRDETLSRRSILSKALALDSVVSPKNSLFSHDELNAHHSNIDIPGREFDWNSSRDTDFAHQKPIFDRVCHLFHKEWHGIRSAAGNLPGHKLAISENTSLSTQAITEIANELEYHKIQKIIMHGFSKNMDKLRKALKRLGHEDFFLVWHGNSAQLAYPDESLIANLFFELIRKKEIKGFHLLRSGFGEAISNWSYNHQLLNLYPNLPSSYKITRAKSEKMNALIPSWNDVRKNLYTNILAAEKVAQVQGAWVFADNIKLPSWLSQKVKRLPKPEGREIFGSMLACDLVFNATVIDCHPMVDLEALAFNRPVVMGPLFLDGLEQHPYTKLATVANPLSVLNIIQVAEKLIAVDYFERDQMIESYKATILGLSLERYAEFLGV